MWLRALLPRRIRFPNPCICYYLAYTWESICHVLVPFLCSCNRAGAYVYVIYCSNVSSSHGLKTLLNTDTQKKEMESQTVLVSLFLGRKGVGSIDEVACDSKITDSQVSRWMVQTSAQHMDFRYPNKVSGHINLTDFLTRASGGVDV